MVHQPEFVFTSKILRKRMKLNGCLIMGDIYIEKKYRVVYYKDKCISAFTCVAFYPERWVINNNDNKADLVGGWEDPQRPGVWIFDFNHDELEQFKQSAMVCPVQIIEIYNKETGVRIFPM